MPFVKKVKNSQLSVVASKSNPSNNNKAQEIVTMPGGGISLKELKINLDDVNSLPINKPKQKRRRKTSHLVGTWRAPTRQPRKTTKPLVASEAVNDGRIIKRRRRQNTKLLTSPQRSSLRQLISKRKISTLVPVQCFRAVEFTQNPQLHKTDCNKILFAASLELLPSQRNEAEDTSDSSLLLGDFETLDEKTSLIQEKYKAQVILKKRIATVHDAWMAVVLSKDKILGTVEKTEEDTYLHHQEEDASFHGGISSSQHLNQQLRRFNIIDIE